MNRLIRFFNYNVLLLLLILLLVGCTGGANDEAKSETSGSNYALDSEQESGEKEENKTNEEEGNQSESATVLDESGAEDSKDSSGETSNEESNNATESVEDDRLSNYSSEEIEYARVWLQLGEIKQVDELNVRHIPAGTSINPNDNTSASYPEDVIQLAGSRLVAGSITYSGNGDGTINIYQVPLRWDGKYPAGEKFYNDIMENTEFVQVDPGNDEDIIDLIKVLNIHE